MEQNKKSGRFRPKKIFFSQVSNSALRDSNLSLKAKGLYALISSYITIPDFILYKTTLRKDTLEGERAFENAWKELKDKGYLIQYKLKDELNGRYFYEYELLDEADCDLANNVHSANNPKNSEEKIHPPQNVGMEKNNEKIHPLQNVGVENAPSGKVGIYNNTDSNNTNLNNTDISTSTGDNISDLKYVVELFEKNICKLRKTTLPKFIKIANKKGISFIIELIKYCSEHGTTSFKGFELINKQYANEEQLKVSTFNYKQNKDTSNKIRLFREKNYDYDALERELLGWDD